MRGPEVTPQLIDQFIAPVVPATVRDALAAGHAEWTMRHQELGQIRVVADREAHAARASFFLVRVAHTCAPAV